MVAKGMNRKANDGSGDAGLGRLESGCVQRAGCVSTDACPSLCVCIDVCVRLRVCRRAACRACAHTGSLRPTTPPLVCRVPDPHAAEAGSSGHSPNVSQLHSYSVIRESAPFILRASWVSSIHTTCIVSQLHSYYVHRESAPLILRASWVSSIHTHFLPRVVLLLVKRSSVLNHTMMWRQANVTSG